MKTFFAKHRSDLLLICALLILSGAMFLFFLGIKQEGAWAVVTVDGVETARYSLAEPGTYPLNGGSNILEVTQDAVWLSSANCPDKLCVNQGKIRFTGECIVCLPNKLTVTIEGAEGTIDLVS